MSPIEREIRHFVRILADPCGPWKRDEAVVVAQDLLDSLGVPRAVHGSLSGDTLRYYRDRGIVEPPEGNTRNARYLTRHILQLCVARLAGHLHEYTLSEAAEEVPTLEHEDLVRRLAVLVEKALEEEATQPRPLPGRTVYGTRPASDRAPEPLGVEEGQPVRVRTAMEVELSDGGRLTFVPGAHPGGKGQAHTALVAALREALEGLEPQG